MAKELRRHPLWQGSGPGPSFWATFAGDVTGNPKTSVMDTASFGP